MDYDYIKYIKDHNAALKLLRLEHSPLIISFLFTEYKKNNQTSISNAELSRNLTDYIYSLRQKFADDSLFPDTAEHYLDRWANEGFLRKYYTSFSDVPYFDLTPDTEKALEWVSDLTKKEFVGTESRLLKIFEMLKELVYKNSTDPVKRLKELKRQKQDIEEEIKKINSGHIEQYDSTQIKERYYDLEDTARKLLSDFKQVEYNFRELDREARENQINDNLTKGKFLENIFKVQDLLYDTDQGKTFKAFWEFIMSRTKQDELEELLKALKDIPEIRQVKKGNFIDRLKINLVEAGNKVHKTNHLLIDQLSRYLSEKNLLENKRIIELIKEIKSYSLEVKNKPPQLKKFIEIEEKPDLSSVMNRELFNPPAQVIFEENEINEGGGDFDNSLLYNMIFIDKEELKQQIKELLRYSTQVSLTDIIKKYPITRGVAEIIAYLDIADKDDKAYISDNKEKIIISNNETGKDFRITINQIIYNK